jgi:AcrR family transcriptional regulator
MSTLLRKTQNRGIETKARIVEVTKQLLSDHDFYSVTLDQISSQAEISKSSLLWHFESKEDLLCEAALEIFTELENAVIIEAENELPLQLKINKLLVAVAEYFQINPEPKGVLISLVFNSQIPNVIRERIDAYWDHHVDEIVKYLSCPEHTFSKSKAKTILDIIHGCYMHWYLHKDEEKFFERLTQSFQHLDLHS